ncbi:MAG: hypothetical protein ACJKTH_03210 [Patescibacteria group bacterium UBA2163]
MRNGNYEKPISFLRPQFPMTEARVIPESDHEYTLCSSAESRLFTSMREGFTIIVDDCLVLKFEGRMAALCTHDFVAADGSEFKAGYWYAPYKQTRLDFKDAYESGVTRVNDMSYGEWVCIRECRDAYDVNDDEYKCTPSAEVVEQAAEYAETVSGERLSEEEAERRVHNTYNERSNIDRDSENQMIE